MLDLVASMHTVNITISLQQLFEGTRHELSIAVAVESLVIAIVRHRECGIGPRVRIRADAGFRCVQTGNLRVPGNRLVRIIVEKRHAIVWINKDGCLQGRPGQCTCETQRHPGMLIPGHGSSPCIDGQCKANPRHFMTYRVRPEPPGQMRCASSGMLSVPPLDECRNPQNFNAPDNVTEVLLAMINIMTERGVS